MSSQKHHRWKVAGFAIETNPLCNNVYGGVPMSVTGNVFDTQLLRCLLLGCVCVFKLNLYACHLERGATCFDLMGCSPHLKVNTSQFPILKFKYLLGADVEFCNFLVEKSDKKCLFLKARYQGAVSVCTNDSKNL
jgi:hypothetical protein